MGRALGLSLLVCMTLDIDPGPLSQLSVMGSKNQGRQSLLKPLWDEEAPDTGCGQAPRGPTNAALNLRGPGLSNAESPSKAGGVPVELGGQRTGERELQTGTERGDSPITGHRAGHSPTMGHRAWHSPTTGHRAWHSPTTGHRAGTAQLRDTEHGTA